jgi:hypothetical protein
MTAETFTTPDGIVFDIVSTDGAFSALEDADQRPHVASSAGIFPVRTGTIWQSPHSDDDLIATLDGWKSIETAEVDTYGAIT